jgi:metal-responsive CopG/Arc/MetJ family transcriptional regulator
MMCRTVRLVIKTTIYLPDELHRELKRAAKERGTSEAELIRAAVRHELLGAPPGQAERAQRRARLLAAMGTLDSLATQVIEMGAREGSCCATCCDVRC